MADLIVDIANCPIMGEEFSWTRNPEPQLNFLCRGARLIRRSLPSPFRRERPVVFELGDGRVIRKGESWHSSRDMIRLSLPPFRAELKQLTLEFRKNIWQETTQLTIADISSQQFEEAKAAAGDLCWLLMLATMSPVMPFAYQYGKQRSGHSTSGRLQIFRPTIETQDGSAVRAFCEACWLEFRRLKASRQLVVPIHYLVDADSDGVLSEVRLLMAYAALENLKATFADGTPGITFNGKHYVEKDTAGKQRPLGFKILLERMLAAVGMTPPLDDLIELRNEIVHRGLSNKSFPELRTQYEHAQDILREYLLRLLGFKGLYIGYGSLSPVVL